jgi:hypothetical protein
MIKPFFFYKARVGVKIMGLCPISPQARKGLRCNLVVVVITGARDEIAYQQERDKSTGNCGEFPT